jgi:Tfp pilus assembly protein PilN
MIRANLLPRREGSLGSFAARLADERLRHAASAIALVLAIAFLSTGLELLRVRRLEAEAASAAAAIAANAPRRESVRLLALDVARLQEIAHFANALHESGNDVALQVARVGNTLPPDVWLDNLGSSARGFDFAGRADSIDAVGQAVAALGARFPERDATLTSVERRDDDRYAFDAALGSGQ